MISKELLSKVLKENITYIELKGDTNYVQAGFKNSEIVYVGKLQKRKKINIYELAHKCKEWVFNKGYELRTSTIGIVDVYDHIYIDKEDGLTGVFINCRKEADTEPEAIFKACEYIMENKCGS